MKIKGEHREENIEESKLPFQLEESRSATKGSKEVRRIRGQQLAKQRKWRSPHGGRKKNPKKGKKTDSAAGKGVSEKKGNKRTAKKEEKGGTGQKGGRGKRGLGAREKGCPLGSSQRAVRRERSENRRRKIEIEEGR
ncbi:hypothetical protein FF1_037927 [Malus domestica]